MILYLVHDSTKNTYSHPLVAPDLATVNASLLQLNPENLSSLKIIVLDTLDSLDDLIHLKISKPKKPKTISTTSSKSYKYDDPEWQSLASKRSKAVWARSKKISKKSHSPYN